MSRIQQLFERTRQANRAALIGYITAGDPDVKRSLEIIDTACSGGLDLLELGIPFSDPMADGPVIQRASSRAIQSGMTLEKGIEMVRQLRKKHDLPIILFSYFNPIFAAGAEKFVNEAISAGADGVLCVDLPSENSDEIMQFVKEPNRFHFIRLVAPTTSAERRREILRRADGFVYVVSRRGVTGGSSGAINWNELNGEVAEMRKETPVPLCIGFGISTPEDVKAVGKIADGVIIGSAFQRLIEDSPDTAPARLREFLRSIAG
jgi:tryptophan synthase alpha chain